MIKRYLLFLLCVSFVGCGVYTFSGSTLPSHLKTVDIPLFTNQSLQPGVAEDITAKLNSKVQEDNLLKPVSQNSDATITGKVLSYDNRPYTYGSKSVRNVDVSSYSVKISVEVEFLDNKKDKTIYKGVITEEGIYDFEKETEEVGKEKSC